MIRPEARETILRTSGIWGPLLSAALGLWWVLVSGGLLRWIGCALIALSAGLVWAGWQRLKFLRGNDGPGVVRVDEGQVAYFGPLTGGAVARSDLTAVTLDKTGKPAHWVLSQPGQPDLMIPVNADGAEALFDVFAALPGLRTPEMLAALDAPERVRMQIWQEPGRARLTTLRLH